jgi:hypothetical protein
VLVNKRRYESDFRAQAGMFATICSWVASYLADVPQEKLLLAAPPADAVVWENARFKIVSVEGLRRAWGM